ncbi:formylglycine-generating enzyme family protein [Rhodocytophaga rosea]|uniref:Formylglycine-generating enzyme family protein n=1 Tax=Rhodocytophaga rosea TaxID=2704465 RepID=A0A6C0GPV8_9BACT|nr:formylglycine-generating enzyme family protein [Rhodocytophaga rosea]QHT70105.1 formylglycine-generating enzyme family protein [Rhodocytophaga rosea]
MSISTCLLAQSSTKPQPAKSADFAAYTEQIPGTKISFDMVPIQGGEYLMGSPATEASRKEDEGPQHTVKIEPFWMGKHEITWDEYELFMYQEKTGNPAVSAADTKAKTADTGTDAISTPSPPYVDMSFGMGKYGFPAVNMTQYAARMYCKWLSAKTGHFYRLPTEAEWEYACRANTKTAYHFGDDPAQLNEYAWHYENSNSAYKKVGTKKPNPWGLYDMHGNVAEMTLDQYLPDFYAKSKQGAVNPWSIPKDLYPHTSRGGSWDDDKDRLRSAARIPSKPTWKKRDPQIPRSDWWFTDASFSGFRIIRPVKQPTKAEMEAYYTKPPEDI